MVKTIVGIKDSGYLFYLALNDSESIKPNKNKPHEINVYVAFCTWTLFKTKPPV